MMTSRSKLHHSLLLHHKIDHPLFIISEFALKIAYSTGKKKVKSNGFLTPSFQFRAPYNSRRFAPAHCKYAFEVFRDKRL